jgi:hypothetical protein
VLTVASTQYSLSIFVKAAGVRYLHTVLDDGVVTGGYATFDLQTGTVSQIMTAIGAGVLGVASIQLISNGIYRCTIVTSIGTGVNARILFMCSNTGTPSTYPNYAGNAANGLLIWGAQLEAGTFPTSYIPTTAASVTRAIDSAIMNTSPWYINALALSCVVDGMQMAAGGAPVYFEFDDGTNSNRMSISVTAALNVQYFENNGGVATANFQGGGAIQPGVPFKSGFSSSSGQHGYVVNGGIWVPSTSAANPPTVTTLRLGKGNAVTAGSSYLRRLRYWPRALAPIELQAVTT